MQPAYSQLFPYFAFGCLPEGRVRISLTIRRLAPRQSYTKGWASAAKVVAGLDRFATLYG